MTTPQSIKWKAPPHTQAKHEILRRYLAAWFPILASGYNRLLYIDGFAGPGRYESENQDAADDGSPIIALKAAHQHFARLQHAELAFVFVERKPSRAALLEREIAALQLPPSFKVQVLNGEFAPILRALLENADATAGRDTPTFAFVDPFGIKGVPFELIRRLLRRENSEILVNFMGSRVNRFVKRLPGHVNELIGTDSAAEAVDGAINGVAEARRLYEAELRKEAAFVRFFQMRDAGNVPIYDLFFASNHPLGHAKMKEAMWKVDASGTFSFSDATSPTGETQLGFFAAADLAARLWEEFRTRGPVTSDEVTRFVVDKTEYLEKHAKAALQSLEAEPRGARRVEVADMKLDGKKRRARTFPAGAVIRFVE